MFMKIYTRLKEPIDLEGGGAETKLEDLHY